MDMGHCTWTLGTVLGYGALTRVSVVNGSDLGSLASDKSDGIRYGNGMWWSQVCNGSLGVWGWSGTQRRVSEETRGRGGVDDS